MKKSLPFYLPVHCWVLLSQAAAATITRRLMLLTQELRLTQRIRVQLRLQRSA